MRDLKQRISDVREATQLRIYYAIQDIFDNHGWWEHHDTTTNVLGWIQEHLCWIHSHSITMDQCGLPEHDYCLYCNQHFSGLAVERKK